MTDPGVRETHRWAGLAPVAWAIAGVGLLTMDPGIFLLTGVAVVFAAYGRVGTPPDPDLRVERTVDEPRPDPGEEVTVTLTVAQDGGATLPDVRIVDGLPEAFSVREGSPHHGTVLGSGGARTFSYTVRAERGSYVFDPVTVVCRSLGGSHETVREVPVETTIECLPSLTGTDVPPLRSLVSHHRGQVPTDSGGSGLEFYGVREYRPGDRANRIDWARKARTGELTTLQYREERMASVVVLVDARSAAYVRPGEPDDAVHAVESSVRGAGEMVGQLLGEGNWVGIAAVGRDFAWLDPGTGPHHRLRVRELLGTHPAFSPTPPSEFNPFQRLPPFEPELEPKYAAQFRHLRLRLPADAQVFFCSPVADEAAVTMASRLEAAGHAVTTISPGLFRSTSAGTTLAGIQRDRRLRTLERAGVRVVDWDQGEALAVAFERASEGWS